MSGIMLKALADMAGIKPDDVRATIEKMQFLAAQGIDTLEDINKRISRIEKALNIESEENGQEN